MEACMQHLLLQLIKKSNQDGGYISDVVRVDSNKAPVLWHQWE